MYLSILDLLYLNLWIDFVVHIESRQFVVVGDNRHTSTSSRIDNVVHLVHTRNRHRVVESTSAETLSRSHSVCRHVVRSDDLVVHTHLGLNENLGIANTQFVTIASSETSRYRTANNEN